LQLVREAAWAAIEGNVSMETITVPKTSLHADVQAAVEKELGLGMYFYLFSKNLVLTIKNSNCDRSPFLVRRTR
jgi:hypothetical protein